jgi:hypothetical protein
MVFAATFKAVELGVNKLTFSCHTSKWETVIKGEYGFSKALLAANMNFDTLLTKYARVDWRKKTRHSLKCNKNIHPTRNLSYFAPSGLRLTVHPFETIFYKPVWLSADKQPVVLSEAYVNETWEYLEWALKRRIQDNLI